MIGVVVVSFGSHALLESNLTPLDLGGIGTPVFVVDNFRSVASQDAVRDLADVRGWDLTANTTNVGFGAAMNAGVARALGSGCSGAVLLNPDIRISLDVLRALGEQVGRTPRALVSPRIVRPDGTPWFTGGRIDVAAGRTRNIESLEPSRDGWLSGACLAVPAEMWQEVGGFDDDYFLYWEDVDLSHRCVSVGGELLVRQDLVVVHDVGGTQKTRGRAKSSVYYYYNCRNRLLFAAKNLPRRDVLRWLARSPGYARDVLMRGGRRQLLRSLRPLVDVTLGSATGSAHAIRAMLRRTH